MSFKHQSVLLEETVAAVFTRPDGIYVDGTLGGGGHAEVLLKRLSAQGRLLCFDQDEAAWQNGREKFGDDKRVRLFHRNFSKMEEVLRAESLLPVTGVTLDLGVSSPQLDEAERGFSYMQDAPLDMRMDRSQELTASQIVNQWSREEITQIIRRYGEERWAGRIASLITHARQGQEIATTSQLTEIIKKAVPAAARREGPHPAKRTFQALRIAVNGELTALEQVLEQMPRLLESGGRVAVITFHSLEDRLVKQKFMAWEGPCTCPPGMPVCTCQAKALARSLTKKPMIPTREETEQNPRCRSAKLRVAEKL